MTKITAKVIADSKNDFGTRITTMVVTFPRYILAELNTHRVLSKNSASSRAIPFENLLKSVEENPFIPIAWMKDHKGMQGTAFFTDEDNIGICKTGWLEARDNAVGSAKYLSACNLTKQLVNRLLEPFMWHTVIISATDWPNFFALRCPQYHTKDGVFRSKVDAITASIMSDNEIASKFPLVDNEINWLKINKGQADIHMMALAEAMWDAYNESTPKLLEAGEWHIVYEDKIKEMFNLTQKDLDTDGIPFPVKIGSIMAARISYTVVGTELSEWTKEKYAVKCNELTTARPLHASPFEHCAQNNKVGHQGEAIGNFRGFTQYRKMLAHENITE